MVPALYCSWNSGAEGTYQLMIFTQIFIALLLPSSVIPLFLVVTPLNSASFRPDVQKWDIHDIVPEISFIEEEIEKIEKVEHPRETQSLECDFNLPDEILDYDSGPQLTAIEEDSHDVTVLLQPEVSPIVVESVTILKKEEDDESVEKTLRIDGNSRIVKENERNTPATLFEGGCLPEPN